MTIINIDQTTPLVADTEGEEYVINAKIHTPGPAIDASGAISGRVLTINGTVHADSGTAVTLGDASLADSKSFVKVGLGGTFISGGAGLVAASGGVTFTNVGTFQTELTGVEFDGDGNIFTNDAKMTSNAGAAVVSHGDGDQINNAVAAIQATTISGSITAKLDAILSTGNHTQITNGATASVTSMTGSAIVSSGSRATIINHGTVSADTGAIVSSGANAHIINDDSASVISTTGAAIVSSGKRTTIINHNSLTGDTDVIVSTGAMVNITNAGDGSLNSNHGRGIVSKGDDATITNQAGISTSLDGIFSSGANATITNGDNIGSWTGAAIRSIGAGATISNSANLNGKSFGIFSSGDHAAIYNNGFINAKQTGIAIAGDGSMLQTTANIAAGVALRISGDGTHVSIENEISGSAKHSAAIVITSTGNTVITNHGAVSASGSGTVIEAGNGAEHIVNTGSLYGVVNLGGGDDVFRSKGQVTGAVNAGAGNDRIVNTGELQYDVNLGAGNDVFSSLKGSVGGKVIGGKGDDLYIVGSDLDIREARNGGIDTVHSKFTYTLGANIENLRLLGKGTMDATGNNLANRIEGNSGNNHLTGLGGKDVFVFETGSRQDIITDFTDHKDHIDLSGYAGIDSFADLHGKITQSGQDVVITLDGHDRLTIEHAHKGDFSAADFIF